MTRRTALTHTMKAAAGAGAAALIPPALPDTPKEGRLKQSVSWWTYKKYMSLDDLCKEAVRIGLKGIDLVEPPDWPTIQKHGLVPSMTTGAGTIPDGFNRLDNHARLETQMRENVARAAEAGLPNVITFSGNRKGMPDAEGLANCVTGLNRVKKIAEEKNVTINMELLNSKVNHKDYMCDHTAWGVEVCKRVDSPRVKLLYDIYHMQIMEGDIIRTIRDNFAFLGHFHTGGVPNRHEIDGTQELDYHAVAKAIADLGYKGFIAHEFVPSADPIPSLEKAFQICTV
ncbi:MAG: TIM barrel protein [Acidobacteriota bacterium]|nr:TIM barrel protein [Acidobacteriota bacterium]